MLSAVEKRDLFPKGPEPVRFFLILPHLFLKGGVDFLHKRQVKGEGNVFVAAPFCSQINKLICLYSTKKAL